MKIKARIRVGCWSSNAQPHTGFRIELRDETSGVYFGEADLRPEQIALLLAGREQECDMELRGLDKLGMVREHDTRIIAVPESVMRTRSDDAARAFLEPFERDGWTAAWPGEIFNHRRHKRQEDGVVRVEVGFIRYVPPPETLAEAA